MGLFMIDGDETLELLYKLRKLDLNYENKYMFLESVLLHLTRDLPWIATAEFNEILIFFKEGLKRLE